MSWDGLLLINKPKGQTSHQVVQFIRKRLGMLKAGHLGTLDPLATGVFPVCLGKATRLAPFYMSADKCYEAALRFGFFTSTDDSEGVIEGPRTSVKFRFNDLDRLLQTFRGDYLQRPPAYSAKKIAGQKAYQLARKGQPAQLPLQKVKIYDLRLIRFEADIALIHLHCSSGTYVRSIARDLGKRISCGAHVAELTRTQFNKFKIEQTCDPEVSLDDLKSSFIPLENCLTHFPELILNSDLCKRIQNGSAVSVEQLPQVAQEWVRVFTEQKALLALARVESQEHLHRIQPKIVFH
jgi:tRNA pseudouridine55 synthase